MSPRDRRLAALLLPCSLALAVAGQFYFATRPEFLLDAVALYALGAALLLAAARLTTPAPLPMASPGKPRWLVVADWARAHPGQTLLALTSVVGTVWVGSRASSPLSPDQGYGLLWVWLVAQSAYLAATDPFESLACWLRSLRARWHSYRWEWLSVLALTIGAGLARLTDLEHIPYVLGGDEASLALQGLEVLWGRITNPFTTGWLSHPTMFAYVQALGLRLAGVTITGARLLPALAGVLTVPALYMLVRQLYGRWAAFLAAGFLASYHYAVHYSRLSYNNIFDPLLAVLAVLALEAALRVGHPGLFALSGLLLGLGQYFYMGARVIPLVVVVWLAVVAWREPGFWRRQRAGLAVLVGAFLVTGWPLFVFFARSPNDFFARTTQLGIIQSGWLARMAAETGRSQLSLLWEQCVKSVLAFNYYPDPASHYHPGIPLLDFASSVPFTLGLAYSLARWRERPHLLMQLWFWGVLIFGSVLLENPPSSQRLVLATIPASIFVALGLQLVTETAARVWRWRLAVGRAAAAVVLALVASVNVWFYFDRYTPAHQYAGYNTEVGQAMGLYLRTLGDSYRYYFLGAPRMYAGFPNTTYLAPAVAGEDITEPLTGPVPRAAPDRKPVYLILPERLGELQWLQATYPRGQLREFPDAKGRTLFAAYLPGVAADDVAP